MNFKEINVLSLSYKNILKIQNLDGLFRLEKIQLDNNLIERIESALLSYGNDSDNKSIEIVP